MRRCQLSSQQQPRNWFFSKAELAPSSPTGQSRHRSRAKQREARTRQEAQLRGSGDTGSERCHERLLSTHGVRYLSQARQGSQRWRTMSR